MIFNLQYTAEAQATAIRLVRCEECEADYVYELKRETQAYGNSVYGLDNKGAKRRAEQQATKSLQSKMKSAADVVPCPECGHVQDHMRPQARFERAIKIGLIGGGTLLLSIAMVALGEYTRLGNVGFILAGVFFLATIVIGIIAMVAHSTFDPNRKPESVRLALAEERASSRAEFEKAFAKGAKEEFEKFCRKLGKKKANNRFQMLVWVDRGQVRRGETIKARLPNGEPVSIRLREDDGDGEEFPFDREVDGHPIKIVCILNTYTKTKS